MTTTRLLIACADQPGIVAAVSAFLFERGANIVDSAQHSTDPEDGTFFMRMEFLLTGPGAGREQLEPAFTAEVGDRFQMRARFSFPGERKRMGILVSRYEHCLLDLLWRWRGKELDTDVAGVASNHPDLEQEVRRFGLEYTHVPVTKETKPAAEATLVELFRGKADFLVLARYMQILSPGFLEELGMPVINIHHSFLPAFVGANPYRRAHERGVRLIGATAHYVTEDLDEGPIIEQDVQRVTHRQDPLELERIGKDVERVVLARAVRWHVDDRVIVHGNKTFVFE